ncbi:MAG: bactofilin family protein [Candidatus Rokuibacteriota bacterium]
MALFGKERERGERPATAAPEATGSVFTPAPREVEMTEREREIPKAGEVGGTSAFLGKGSRVTGKLQFEGTVRIEGQVEGEVTAQDTLVIGESAVVNAQVNGTSIIVHGKITGDVTARKRLEIHAPGKVYGNINVPSLVIHEGVIFEGQCTMGGGEAQRAEQARKVAFLSKDERPGDGLTVRSEIAK